MPQVHCIRPPVRGGRRYCLTLWFTREASCDEDAKARGAFARQRYMLAQQRAAESPEPEHLAAAERWRLRWRRHALLRRPQQAENMSVEAHGVLTERLRRAGLLLGDRAPSAPPAGKRARHGARSGGGGAQKRSRAADQAAGAGDALARRVGADRRVHWPGGVAETIEAFVAAVPPSRVGSSEGADWLQARRHLRPPHAGKRGEC